MKKAPRKNKATLVASNIGRLEIRKIRNSIFIKIPFTGISENNFNSDGVTYEKTNEVAVYLDIEFVPYFTGEIKKALGAHFKNLYAEINRLQNAFKNGIIVPE